MTSASENKRLIFGRWTMDTLLMAAFLIFILLAYIFLHLKFNKEDVDDAWTLSFIYNDLVKHTAPEATFGSGLANIHLFGMTQAYLYTAILNIIGWTKGNAHLVSTLLIAASSFLWYQILRKLRFSKEIAVLFAALILWCEPFMREANIARPESLTFLLITLSFYLFVIRQPFFSGLAALVAFENHPMGLMALVLIAAYIASEYKVLLSDKKKLITLPAMLLLGALIGVAYYLFFHYRYIAGMSGAVNEASKGVRDSVLYDYFFVTAKFHRHIVEFLFFLGCFIVYLFRKGWRKSPFVICFLAFSIVVNFINPRLNYHYTLYFYTSMLLMSLAALEGTKWLRLGVAYLFIIFLAYYASILYRNRSFDFNGNTRLLQAVVPGDTRPILGSPNEWFAFKDREFYPSTYTMYFNSNAQEIYSIEENDFRDINASDSQRNAYKEFLNSRYSSEFITNVSSGGESFVVKLLKKKKS